MTHPPERPERPERRHHHVPGPRVALAFNAASFALVVALSGLALLQGQQVGSLRRQVAALTVLNTTVVWHTNAELIVLVRTDTATLAAVQALRAGRSVPRAAIGAARPYHASQARP